LPKKYSEIKVNRFALRMLDFINLLWKISLEARKEQIFDLLDNEPESVKSVSAFFADTGLIAELKSNANLNIEYLSAHHNISLEDFESYYKFSKFKYEVQETFLTNRIIE
jgi:hypothetical protein